MGATLELNTQTFDPDTTLASGQTFRIRKDGSGVWSGMVGGDHIVAMRDGNRVLWKAEGSRDESYWRQYLDLDRDYAALLDPNDPVLQRAMSFAPGMRVLRQDPFEALIGSIISANNNVARIGKILDAIADACGTRTDHGSAFPTPAQMARLSEADFRSLGAGYRATYLEKSVARSLDTDFNALAALPYKTLHHELLAFAGVGPKVADCVALFGFGKTEAFPVDVWMARAMRQLYGLEGTPTRIRAMAEEMFGAAAGIAQQYLFHYARAHLPRGS